jgi:hypothetical protein
LPKVCPPSFSHETGKIVYELKRKIDKSWALDEKSTVCFQVLPDLDLNKFNHLRIGAGAEDTKYLCCGPCLWFKKRI